MKTTITYMSGAGNLFTVLDGRKVQMPHEEFVSLAPRICRKSEVNEFVTEGLLIIKESKTGFDFETDFYNPDGSFGAMCGNGSRCAVYYAIKNNFFKVPNDRKINFRMAGSIYNAEISDDLIKVFFPPPFEIIPVIKIGVDDQIYFAGYVNVGSDHLIINYNSLSQEEIQDFFIFDINKLAVPLRFHKNFEPRGVNVNFYKVTDKNNIHLRTYERGVEAETGACGTGSISTAIISALRGEIEFPVNIFPTSGERLIIDIIGGFPDKIKNVILAGNAVILNRKEIDIY